MRAVDRWWRGDVARLCAGVNDALSVSRGDSARSPAEGKIRRLSCRRDRDGSERPDGSVERCEQRGLGWWEAYVLTFRGDAARGGLTFRRFAATPARGGLRFDVSRGCGCGTVAGGCSEWSAGGISAGGGGVESAKRRAYRAGRCCHLRASLPVQQRVPRALGCVGRLRRLGARHRQRKRGLTERPGERHGRCPFSAFGDTNPRAAVACRGNTLRGLRSGELWGLEREQTQAQLEKGHCAVNVHLQARIEALLGRLGTADKGFADKTAQAKEVAAVISAEIALKLGVARSTIGDPASGVARRLLSSAAMRINLKSHAGFRAGRWASNILYTCHSVRSASSRFLAMAQSANFGRRLSFRASATPVGCQNCGASAPSSRRKDGALALLGRDGSHRGGRARSRRARCEARQVRYRAGQRVRVAAGRTRAITAPPAT